MLLARAHAKLNLCLAVSPPEPPGSPRAGWHRIASWFAAIDLHDDLTFERADTTTYERAWAPDAPRPTPIDWPEEADLACRAHRLLESIAGRPLPVRMRLRKRIPTGGGLGGGSSDAAAVLRAVTRLYELPLTRSDLRLHSRRLGSDVEYFIAAPAAGVWGVWDVAVASVPPGASGASGAHAGVIDLTTPPAPALVTGFGDSIARAGRPTGPVTLILPEFGCATPAVYRAFDGLGPRAFRDADVARLADARRAWSREVCDAVLFNDLDAAAESIEPGLVAIRRELESAGHRVHMSGSGSTLFALGEARVGPPRGFSVVRAAFA